MFYIVEGLKYGLIAGGWLIGFVGMAVMFGSFCGFVGWIISLIVGDE